MSEQNGIQPVHYLNLNGGSPKEMEGEIAEEALACISVNAKELATFMVSPTDLDKLALGFLYLEGLIQSIDEVRELRVSAGKTCVDVWLHKMDFEPPKRAIITAGCGGGVTFDDLSAQRSPLDVDLQAAPQQLAGLMRQMHLGAEMYQRARGIHAAALADHERILLQVEDVGRHNCIDKLAGAALQAGLPTRGKILLSSGRISSEMINKARRLETPIVCSRTSPTSLSIALADAWNMTLVGYMRQDRMRIYTHAERLEIR